MSAPALNDDFRDLLACLRDDRVEFVIVGAHALAAHHLPRATGDLDVFVCPSADNAVRVFRALLIRNKRAAGRPKDLVDVAALERAPD